MEDVKGQIFENLIGSQEAFLSVANLLEGKEGTMALDVFLKKMEKGELLAKDFLPLLGKYWSDFAKAGGKLDKVLNNNQTAMMRLSNTFKNFQNAFFEGGFEGSLTATFNTFAQVLRDNVGLARVLGQGFKAVADHLLNGLTLLIDIGTIIRIEILEPLWNTIPEGMRSWLADNAALLASITVATGAFKLLLGTLKLIFGLGSLGKGLGLAKAATEAGKVLTIFERMQGFLTGLSALVTKMTGLAIALSSLNKDGSVFDFSNLAKSIIPGNDITGLNMFSNILNPNSSILAPFRNQPTMSASNWAAAGQQGTLKVEIVPKDSEFGRAIEARISENDNRNFNMAGAD